MPKVAALGSPANRSICYGTRRRACVRFVWRGIDLSPILVAREIGCARKPGIRWCKTVAQRVPQVKLAAWRSQSVDSVPAPVGPVAAVAGTAQSDAVLIGGNNLAQVLGVHARREHCRTDEVREHHRDLAALGGISRCGRSRCRNGRSGSTLGESFEVCDRSQQFAAMAKQDAELSRSWSVRSGSTLKSIAFSWNAVSYCSRPRLRSQPPMSMIVPQRLPAIIFRARRHV
jgi:hypothetical protein